MTFYFKAISILVSFILVLSIVFYFFEDTRLKSLIMIKRLWLEITLATLHPYFKNTMYVQFDPRIKNSKRNIIISNHVNEYDWLFLLTFFKEVNQLDGICIMLKEALKLIPLIGDAMQCFDFIFLVRNKTYDLEIIEQYIRKISTREQFSILIFPEGTYICFSTVTKARKMAEDCGLTYSQKHVLIPKDLGVKTILGAIEGEVDVIDITMINFVDEETKEVYKFRSSKAQPATSKATRPISCEVDNLTNVEEENQESSDPLIYPADIQTFYNVFLRRSQKVRCFVHADFIEYLSKTEEFPIKESFDIKEDVVGVAKRVFSDPAFENMKDSDKMKLVFEEVNSNRQLLDKSLVQQHVNYENTTLKIDSKWRYAFVTTAIIFQVLEALLFVFSWLLWIF